MSDLSALNFRAHLARVIDLMNSSDDVVQHNIDVLHVRELSGVRWLTGFSGSNAFVLLDRSSECAHLFTDSRYEEVTKQNIAKAGASVTVHVPGSVKEQEEMIRQIVGDRTLGINPSAVTVAQSQQLSAICVVAPASDFISQARCAKSEAEIERIAKAAAIADRALQYVLERGLVGHSEQRVQAELDYQMALHGADDSSFRTIVASGPNGAIPHHRASNRVIQNGDMVVIDMGALVDGYHSDMTRSVSIGEPSDELKQMFEITAMAQQVALDHVKDGASTEQIDEAARIIFREAGKEQLFVHGLGHGVGLDIHEEPYLSRRPGRSLQVGEVVTIEPGLYRVGVGGVRIEDLVVVTKDGYRNLTHTPKDLLCLPSAPTT